jgi:hypothetical protein
MKQSSLGSDRGTHRFPHNMRPGGWL